MEPEDEVPNPAAGRLEGAELGEMISLARHLHQDTDALEVRDLSGPEEEFSFSASLLEAPLAEPQTLPEASFMTPLCLLAGVSLLLAVFPLIAGGWMLQMPSGMSPEMPLAAHLFEMGTFGGCMVVCLLALGAGVCFASRLSGASLYVPDLPEKGISLRRGVFFLISVLFLGAVGEVEGFLLKCWVLLRLQLHSQRCITEGALGWSGLIGLVGAAGIIGLCALLALSGGALKREGADLFDLPAVWILFGMIGGTLVWMASFSGFLPASIG